MVVFTALVGIAYPLLITAIGQVGFAGQANGSPAYAEGVEVGSLLIGQSFTDLNGVGLPEWFQSRPSAASGGYDDGMSGGSNFGPENAALISAVTERLAAIATSENISPADIPADAVTASASGLDPDISPEYAYLQVPRIALARGLTEQEVGDLVTSTIQGRDLGILGEPRVNVLALNIALAELDSRD